MIKAIIFDWHGVLDEIKLGGFVKILEQNSLLSAEALTNIIAPLDKQLSVGQIDQKTFARKVADRTGVKQDKVDEGIKYVNQVVRNEDLFRTLPKLRKKYKLAIVSDSPAEKTEKIKFMISLNRFFDAVLFSSDVKMSKTDEKIYLLAADLLNLKPPSCLFVDDNIKNIELAASLGFQTCHFSDVRDLEEALSDYNVPGR